MIDETMYRKKLLEMRAHLWQRIGKTEGEERHEVEEHDDTTAQLWEASEIRDGLDDEAAGELREINKALHRLDTGVFGKCTSCGKAINPKRLEAVPYAELCISCADKA